jgi:autotransporter translocation and assembly factor TamB
MSQQLGDLTASVNVAGDELSGVLRGAGLSVAPLTDLIPEWRIDAGRLDIDLVLAGSPSVPRVIGTATLNEAALFLPAIDTRLEDVSFEAQLHGRDATVQGRATLGDGALRLEARCCNDERATGLLIGERNRLTLPNGLDAVITPSFDLQLTPRQLDVTGSLVVHDGVFEHRGPDEGGVRLSPDFQRVDAPPARPRRFALNLDLRTLIQPGFTLRSERIEATLAGDLRFIMRPPAPPSLFGNLDVLGGELRAYGQALRLTDGALGFVGDPLNPDLAIDAQRDIRSDNQRVGFRVRGSLEASRFELFSDPPRSDNETLSYLIRGRGLDVGASADGTAMALSLGATALNQSGVLAPLNSIPGLSGVTLGAEGTDQDMAATISAYVGNRLYLSYGVGIYEPINALTARLYLRSRLWLEVVSRLESSFDLYYRFDRD